jgi:hypothetical protein
MLAGGAPLSIRRLLAVGHLRGELWRRVKEASSGMAENSLSGENKSLALLLAVNYRSQHLKKENPYAYWQIDPCRYGYARLAPAAAG